MATIEAGSGASDYSITALLIQLSEGNRQVEERLICLVYDELRRLADFGGLTFEEIAFILKTSLRTIKRDWSMARAWLRTELSKAA